MGVSTAATTAGLGAALAASGAESVATLAGATFSAGFTAAMTAGFGAIFAASDTPVVILADSILVSGDRPLEFSTATTSPSGVSSMR